MRNFHNSSIPCCVFKNAWQLLTQFHPSMQIRHRVRLSRRNQISGMTMMELIVVMAIIVILAGVGVSAFQSGGRNSVVSTAAAEVSGMIEGARQLAISSNHRTRFFVVTGSSSNPKEWRLARYGVMREKRLDSGKSEFNMVTPLKPLQSGAYFREDDESLASGVKGPSGGIFDSTSEDHATIQGENVEYAYIEFLPTGGTTGGSGQNLFKILRAPDAETAPSEDQRSNYARIGVAQHTGRVKIQRPEIQ
jgi:prepilin-type N-terminal cleavage/methylation domain-containing protein